MVATEEAPKKEFNDAEILKSVYEKIGGKPADFYKATVTQVHSNSYRINIYTSKPGGDFAFVNQYAISHSLFYIAS